MQGPLHLAPSTCEIHVCRTPHSGPAHPNPNSLGIAVPPPTPASEFVVIYAEEPRILAFRKTETMLHLSVSPAIVISSPGEQACATEKDHTAETKETSESPSPVEGP